MFKISAVILIVFLTVGIITIDYKLEGVKEEVESLDDVMREIKEGIEEAQEISRDIEQLINDIGRE